MSDASPPSSEHAPPDLAARDARASNGGVLETLESIVIAFVLAFVFRAFIVEAFVIPTGSMAPTLLGQHIAMRCPQCGYRFTVGPRDTYEATDGTMVAYRRQGEVYNKQGHRVRMPLSVPCTMCDYEIQLRSAPASAGDRILVLKYIYALTEPRRWDVVVFKNPKQPEVNYIKRLVGLPGEQVWIVEGNIYTRPLTEQGDPPDESVPWRIQRKGARPRVQRAVWQPIYDSDYWPLDGGEPGRTSDREQEWSLPWQPAGRSVDAWSMERGLRWNWNGGSGGAEPGVLRFHFSHERDRSNYYPYNLHDSGRGFDDEGRNTVSELRLAATVMPRQSGLELTLTCGSRDLLVRGRIDAQGAVTIESAQRGAGDDADSSWEVRSRGKVQPLPPGRGVPVELWHVDQSVWMWIDGKLAAGPWEYELSDVGLTLQELAERQEDDARSEPVAQIALRGAPAQLRSIELDRDLYYTQAHRGPGRGTFGGPTIVAPDHFFCLGDNSPSSEDSRRWMAVDPWVLDVHDLPPGFVPRELMLGRAFFVYYPASHHLARSPIGVPNFGDMRFIH